MRIENGDVLQKRIDEVIEAIGDDERYPECLDVLDGLRDELQYHGFEDVKERLCYGLHDADGAYPMHPEVARLLIDIYEDGIENESGDAMCNLGSLYYTGRAGEQNYEKAAHYYHMADLAGNRQATENLGYIYYYGRTGEKDYEKAFKYFVKGALDGHLRSLYKVGDFYRNGYYVEKDPKEAFRIYDHCEDMLSNTSVPIVGADIMMRLGDCYFEGFGVGKDLLVAHHYMSSAENLFYKRLKEGDFYQKRNLEHVLEVLEKIRKEIRKTELPDLSWSGYEG
ncbi:MAG: sel1 repeat family protein [Clostridia bacterium]|nr:sel1 repeat family protein [Clostridia bacterium]